MNYMKGEKMFLDTNIIVYAYDKSAEAKHHIAQQILIDLWQSGMGIISTQVLQEFFVRVTNKISKPLGTAVAKEVLNDFMTWDIVVNDKDSIMQAIDIHTRYRYSFWDALIIQAAIKGGASLLCSEDLQSGQIIHGIKILNPFLS